MTTQRKRAQHALAIANANEKRPQSLATPFTAKAREHHMAHPQLTSTQRLSI
jgi:hypothetical protein